MENENFFSRTLTALLHHSARFCCGLHGLHGHQILLHFEPNKLSLHCALCGYESDGWEVGRPMTARRLANNPQARPDRRRALRPLRSNARLVS